MNAAHSNKKLLIISCLVLMLCGLNHNSNGWGFWGHQRINKVAVFTLPPGMLLFYKQNVDWISQHAVDPDMRRYASKEEAPRHFIDLDRYPKDSMPHNWYRAVEKYSEDTLKAHGIVPWHIQVWILRLTDAMKMQDKNRILRYSAELGHYIADVHVPLHTTKNYNGQLTGQVGIHGFWESRIPELLGEDYDYLTGNAGYIENPLEYTWDIIEQSHAAVDSVLSIEKELSASFATDKIYAFEERNGQTLKMYSSAYTSAYSNKLQGMVERRMRAAILATGSIWYTCWVNAGQPDLSKATDQIPEPGNADAENESQAKSDKQLGRQHDETGVINP